MKRFVPLLVLAGALVLGSGSAGGSTTAAAGVQPNPVNMVDCNGFSPEYTSLKPSMRALCTDPVRVVNGHYSRAYDNGWYLGHDEPSVKFISSAPGSGSSMTYFMKLAVDRRRSRPRTAA